MTVKEARRIVEEFNDNTKNASEEEFFVFSEAMDFLINELHDPRDMLYLGGVYYEMKRFDLALKYYEMSASYDYDPAYECLGYVWYYGRTGERDFKKAFHYFSKLMDKGDLVATYKVADMYKNGYYVPKDLDTYKKMIEKLYPKIFKCRMVDDPVPEICTRLARIRTEEGRTDEAINLYLKAKDWLAQRIHYNAFFGNLSIMQWLIDDLYELLEFDEYDFDFFDMSYLLKTPHKITFEYEGEIMSVESVMEGDECVICYNGKWFRSRDDFYRYAELGEDHYKLTSVADDLYGFEMIE